MSSKRLVLVPYDPAWPRLFQEEADRITAAIGAHVLDRDGRRAVQIHLYMLPAPAWEETLRFRDALRADPELRGSYMAEKQRVAESVAWNKMAYSIAKGPFIRGVLDTLDA